jgi:hypothetical protein
MPFVETQRTASLQKAGPGGIALQSDLQSCLAPGRRKSAVFIFFSRSGANRNSLQSMSFFCAIKTNYSNNFF